MDTDADTIQIEQRRAQATELRLHRKTYDEIAQTLGYPTRQAARESVMIGLRRRAEERREDADALIAQEDEELDRISAAMTTIMEAGGLKIFNGEVVTLDGLPVQDVGPAVAAAGRLLDVQARRARLHGLDAAVKIEQTGNLSVNYTFQGVDTDGV